MADRSDEQDWCAGLSSELGEPIAGSAATGVQRWLLLELAGRWGARPPEDCGWPPGFVAALNQALERAPQVRLQLIRRPGAEHQGDTPRALLAGAGGRWALDFAALLAMSADDIYALITADAPEVLESEPWYLVCTHGTRDRCCAKWGQAVFCALDGRPELRGRVWRTSHLGGHRFAPTLVTLPGGLCYGRVEVDELDELVSATERGEVGLVPKLRGPCHEDQRGQVAWSAAAEAWPGLKWRELKLNREGEGSTRCKAGERSLRVTQRPTGKMLEVLGSCGKAKRKQVALYQVDVEPL